MSTKLALLVAILAVLLSAAPASADSDPRYTLRRVLVLVDQPNRLSPAERAARATVALANLRADPALADQTWLTEPLAASPPDLARENGRVTAALAVLDDAPRTPMNPAARATLDAVLADPRFRPADLTSLLPSWLVPVAVAITGAAGFVWGIIRWLVDQLFLGIARVFGSQAFGPTMAILAVLVTAGVFLLYRRGLRAAIVAQAEIAAPAGELPPTAADAIAAARTRAADGRYRDACHYLLYSALLWIEEHQGMQFDRAATNREHLRRLVVEGPGPRSPLVGAFEPVVQRFDRLWYGQTTITQDDYAELAALVQRVHEVAR